MLLPHLSMFSRLLASKNRYSQYVPALMLEEAICTLVGDEVP